MRDWLLPLVVAQFLLVNSADLLVLKPGISFADLYGGNEVREISQ
jgi:hypothetical protein